MLRTAAVASDYSGHGSQRGQYRVTELSFPHLLDLPAALVVAAVVHKLAGVPEAAEPGFFVVLADVGLVVEAT